MGNIRSKLRMSVGKTELVANKFRWKYNNRYYLTQKKIREGVGQK